MALDITGKLIQLLPLQSGTSTRGSWSKQEFIVETQEQYPKKVCISLWGDKLKDLEEVQIGEIITVSINIESREFNGRWYTDVRAWRIQRNNQEPDYTTTTANTGASNTNTPSPTINDSFLTNVDDSIDDLPF